MKEKSMQRKMWLVNIDIYTERKKKAVKAIWWRDNLKTGKYFSSEIAQKMQLLFPLASNSWSDIIKPIEVWLF